jgi:hypothetical protein
MSSLLKIFFQPRIVASTLKQKPRWVFAFCMVAVLSVSLEALQYQLHLRTVVDLLPPSATADDRAAVVQAMNAEAVTRFAFLPVRLLAGWLLYALMLFYASKIAVARESFRIVQMFSLEVHAEAALLLGKFASAIMLFTTSSPNLPRFTIPFGAVSFFHNINFSQFAFLNSLNLFSIIYILILTAGVSVMCGFRYDKSVIVVVGVWGLSLLANIGILTVLRNELHLLL